MFNFKKSKLILATSFIAAAGISGCSSNQSSESSNNEDADLISMKDDKQQQNIGADQSAVYSTADTGSNEQQQQDQQAAAEPESETESNLWRQQRDDMQRASPISQTITFELDSAELTDEAKRTLRTSLENSPDVPMDAEIVGYTDDTGPEEYNQQLSEKRAQSVRDFIAEMNAEIDNWDVEGRGEQSPTASNDSEWGRSQNRRVSINLEPKEQRAAQQSDF